MNGWLARKHSEFQAHFCDSILLLEQTHILYTEQSIDSSLIKGPFTWKAKLVSHVEHRRSYLCLLSFNVGFPCRSGLLFVVQPWNMVKRRSVKVKFDLNLKPFSKGSWLLVERNGSEKKNHFPKKNHVIQWFTYLNGLSSSYWLIINYYSHS